MAIVDELILSPVTLLPEGSLMQKGSLYFKRKRKKTKHKAKHLSLGRRFSNEMKEIQNYIMQKNDYQTLRHLELAHEIGKESLWRHAAIHLLMMVFAFIQRNWQEVRNQLVQLFYVVPEHLFPRREQGVERDLLDLKLPPDKPMIKQV